MCTPPPLARHIGAPERGAGSAQPRLRGLCRFFTFVAPLHRLRGPPPLSGEANWGADFCFSTACAVPLPFQGRHTVTAPLKGEPDRRNAETEGFVLIFCLCCTPPPLARSPSPFRGGKLGREFLFLHRLRGPPPLPGEAYDQGAPERGAGSAQPRLRGHTSGLRLKSHEVS